MSLFEQERMEFREQIQQLTWERDGLLIDKNTLLLRVAELEHDLRNRTGQLRLLMERIEKKPSPPTTT